MSASVETINNVFEGYPDFEYYALVFEPEEGESKSIIYNEEKARGVEDLFTNETDRIIFNPEFAVAICCGL